MLFTIFMILFLIAVWPFVFFIIKKNKMKDHNDIFDFIIIPLCLSMVIIGVWFGTVVLTSGDTIDDKSCNGYSYTELCYLADHFDELTPEEKIQTVHTVDKWNSRLNNENNYWWKFTIENYDEYIITINNREELYFF